MHLACGLKDALYQEIEKRLITSHSIFIYAYAFIGNEKYNKKKSIKFLIFFKIYDCIRIYDVTCKWLAVLRVVVHLFFGYLSGPCHQSHWSDLRQNGSLDAFCLSVHNSVIFESITTSFIANISRFDSWTHTEERRGHIYMTYGVDKVDPYINIRWT